MTRLQMIAILNTLLPQSRKRAGIQHLIELETRNEVIECVAISQLDDDICKAVEARLSAEMDASFGHTPEMIMREMPEFVAYVKGSQI